MSSHAEHVAHGNSGGAAAYGQKIHLRSAAQLQNDPSYLLNVAFPSRSAAVPEWRSPLSYFSKSNKQFGSRSSIEGRFLFITGDFDAPSHLLRGMNSMFCCES